MARIRSIKPEFFTSETIAALPVTARLTFIGLWTYVDDNGVGPDNARLITAAVWPLEDDPTAALQRTREDLARLHEALLVTRYEHSGKRFLFIATWDEHQKVSHPRKPRYPRPDEPGCTPVTSENAPTPEGSGNPPEALVRTPETFRPEQGAGSRDQGTEELRSSGAVEPREKKKRATRIPDDFTVTPDMVAWAQENCPDVDGRFETDQFVDYWHAKAGKDATKLDWSRTWQTWMRNAQRRAGSRPGNVVALRGDRPQGQSTADVRMGAAMAIAARYAAEEQQS